MKKQLLVVISTILLITGCGGSSSSTVTIPFFGGIWEVTLNIALDECELVIGGGAGQFFEDEHEINQMDTAVELFSPTLFLTDYTGETRSEDSMKVRASVSGDLFGDGIFCEIVEEMAYNDLDGDTASVVYDGRIVCADGFRCDSVLRGRAERVS